MLNNSTTLMQVVVGDSGYQLNFTLQDVSGTVLNITGATLTFNAQLASDPTVQSAGAMAITSPTAGTCSYTPAATAFPVAGTYTCQVVVLFASTETLTFDNIQVVATSRVPQ